MKLTYNRDEWGDYDVFNGSQKVGEIYRSAFANWWVIDTKPWTLMGDKDEGYTRLKDAKEALLKKLQAGSGGGYDDSGNEYVTERH